MGQLLTANVATNLYWFGRHLERIESMLGDAIALFDVIIDTDNGAGEAHYGKLGASFEYAGASDFLHKAVFGDHPANLNTVMEYARENAIICRSQIDADAFGEVIKLHELFGHAAKSAHPIDYRFVDAALSLINEIWGALSCGMERRKSDHFIQLGKLVEKTDLNIRLQSDEETTLSYFAEIAHTVSLVAQDITMTIDETDLAANLGTVNSLIHKIVIE